MKKYHRHQLEELILIRGNYYAKLDRQPTIPEEDIKDSSNSVMTEGDIYKCECG